MKKFKLSDNKKRCEWCLKDELYVKYHDEEWGVPCHDDNLLFEYLFLETFQAGLSWHTILKKRENFIIYDVIIQSISFQLKKKRNMFYVKSFANLKRN